MTAEAEIVYDEAEAIAKAREHADIAARQSLETMAAAGAEKWRYRLEELQARVERYVSLLPRLGGRGARRKAGVSLQDLQMWALVQAQHRQQAAMLKLKELGETVVTAAVREEGGADSGVATNPT